MLGGWGESVRDKKRCSKHYQLYVKKKKVSLPSLSTQARKKFTLKYLKNFFQTSFSILCTLYTLCFLCRISEETQKNLMCSEQEKNSCGLCLMTAYLYNFKNCVIVMDILISIASKKKSINSAMVVIGSINHCLNILFFSIFFKYVQF